MVNFINRLDTLFQTDFSTIDDDGTVHYTDDAEELSGICCEFLINTDGSCNYENIKILKDHGYDVYPTEKDSFGWLMAAVTKDGKKLLYG